MNWFSDFSVINRSSDFFRFSQHLKHFFFNVAFIYPAEIKTVRINSMTPLPTAKETGGFFSPTVFRLSTVASAFPVSSSVSSRASFPPLPVLPEPPHYCKSYQISTRFLSAVRPSRLSHSRSHFRKRYLRLPALTFPIIRKPHTDVLFFREAARLRSVPAVRI